VVKFHPALSLSPEEGAGGSILGLPVELHDFLLFPTFQLPMKIILFVLSQVPSHPHCGSKQEHVFLCLKMLWNQSLENCPSPISIWPALPLSHKKYHKYSHHSLVVAEGSTLPHKIDMGKPKWKWSFTWSVAFYR
jgi:hypothetical protein